MAICRSCRLPAKPTNPEEAERMQRWWLEESGIPFDELLELGEQ